MRILFVLGFPNPFPGAGWTRIGFFADAWSKKGHEVEVLGTFSYETRHKRGAKKTGRVNIFNLILNMEINQPLIFMLNSFASFTVSTFFLLAKKPNVAIVSVPSGDVGLGALMACKLFRVKCAIDYRDEWEDYALGLASLKIGKTFYSFVKNLAADLYGKSHLVVTVTPNVMKALGKSGIGHVRLVPNGADVETFKPRNNGFKNQAFTLFYSGSVMGYYKRALIEVVKCVKNLVDDGLKNVRLRIVGGGEVEQVISLVCRLGITKNMSYEEATTDRARLAQLTADADVGLVPYDDNSLWKNSLPAKFFEYCACGVPVVVTAYDDSILAALVTEYEIGVVSPPLDPRKLAEAIRWIYDHKQFREAAGKKARALIVERYDRQKASDTFLGLIRQIVGQTTVKPDVSTDDQRG